MSNDYKLVILKGLGCSSEFEELYQEAYSHWKSIWTATFKELDGAHELSSDNFTRQDEVLGLFNGDKCIAMVCHRYVDMSLESAQDDSYFKTWPPEAIEAALAAGRITAIGNQISIHPNFRKLPMGVATKDALVWFCLKRLQEQNVESMVGAVREDKSLDVLFERYGATVLAKNVMQHHVPVALIHFSKDKINLKATSLSEQWLSRIYNQRMEDYKAFSTTRVSTQKAG